MIWWFAAIFEDKGSTLMLGTTMPLFWYGVCWCSDTYQNFGYESLFWERLSYVVVGEHVSNAAVVLHLGVGGYVRMRGKMLWGFMNWRWDSDSLFSVFPVIYFLNFLCGCSL